jgi:hypothetical protein
LLRGLRIAGWILTGVAAIGVAGCGSDSPTRTPKTKTLTVTKQPARIASRTFDPASPPADMPPMASGEAAQCDSDFGALVTVGGQPRRTDATHATLTVAQIKVLLSLNVTIWTPPDAAQRIVEHEDGHRQISEYYYQNAEKVAEHIAEEYSGKQVFLEGSDLEAEANKALRQVAADITEEYKKQIDPSRTQLLYDDITDHSRNDVVVKDAVEHAIKNGAVESPQPPASR